MGEEEGDEGKEEVNGEVTTGEKVTGESSDAAAGSNIVKTEEKAAAAASFFWNSMKREADNLSAEKTTKQAREEELNEDTKTIDLATEVMILNMEIINRQKCHMIVFR